MSNMDFDVKGNQAMDFFTGGSIIMDYGIKWKHLNYIFVPCKNTTLLPKMSVDVLKSWIILVFISCLDCHSNGTHSLQRIHCWASNAMLNYSKSFVMKKFDDQGFRKVSVFILFLNDWLTASQLKIDCNMWRLKWVEMLNKSWLN